MRTRTLILFLLFFTLTSAEMVTEPLETIVVKNESLQSDLLLMQINKARNEDSKAIQKVAFTRDTIKQLIIK